MEPYERVLRRLDAWCVTASAKFVAADDGIDTAKLVASGLVRDFRAGLWLLVATGHHVTAHLRSGPMFQYKISLERGVTDSGTEEIEGERDPDLTVGEFYDAPDLDGDQALDAHRADTDDRWFEVLRICGGLRCTVEVTLRVNADATGYHWARTTEVLLAGPRKHGWLPFTRSVFGSDPTPAAAGGGPAFRRATSRPTRIRVEDAGAECLVASGLVVYGPDAKCDAQCPAIFADDLANGTRYAERWLQDDRSALPAPLAVWPVLNEPGPMLEPVTKLLRALAQALTWVWLATDLRSRGKKVWVRLDDLEYHPLTDALTCEGFIKDERAKAEEDPAETDDDPAGTDDDRAEAALCLWQFAVTRADRLGRDAVLGSASDFLRSTQPIYDVRAAEVESRARRLLRLAERGRLAEAIMTLRSAQLAGLATARMVGDGTRAAARSVVERVFIQVAAALGIIVAQINNAFEPEVALALLIVILSVTGGISYVAFHYEYPAAESLHAAFVADLKLHSRDLPTGDLDEIERMEALVSAMATLEVSKSAVRHVLAAGAGVCVLGILVMAYAWQGWAALVVSAVTTLVLAAAWSLSRIGRADAPRSDSRLRGSTPSETTIDPPGPHITPNHDR